MKKFITILLFFLFALTGKGTAENISSVNPKDEIGIMQTSKQSGFSKYNKEHNRLATFDVNNILQSAQGGIVKKRNSRNSNRLFTSNSKSLLQFQSLYNSLCGTHYHNGNNTTLKKINYTHACDYYVFALRQLII